MAPACAIRWRPILSRAGRRLAWWGPMGLRPQGWLAQFRAASAANDEPEQRQAPQ